MNFDANAELAKIRAGTPPEPDDRCPDLKLANLHVEDFYFGRHSRQRIEQMGLTEEEILDTILNCRGVRSKKYEGAYNFSKPLDQNPRINLGCYPRNNGTGWFVATVVWVTHDQWIKDVQTNTYTDREVRDPKDFGK